MKIKKGFISNSSSTSFVIVNKSNSPKTLVDFVEENIYLVDDFNNEYSGNYTADDLIQSAKDNNIKWDALERKTCMFGDEDGTIIGRIFDYILRNGGESNSFTWRFYRSCR